MSAELKIEYDEPRESARVQVVEKPNGLPTFGGESWEDHVSSWFEITEAVESAQWMRGAIVASLETKYGDGALIKFAGEVMLTARSLQLYRQVHNFYEMRNRFRNLSWKHHLVAMYTPDAEAALRLAEDEGLSARSLATRFKTLIPPTGDELPLLTSKEQRRVEREIRKTSTPADLPAYADRCKLIRADITGGVREIEPASVDVIITDPPYPQEFIPLYEDLAKLAARVLKPGGSLLAMIGQSYLPDILALMAPHINYHWTVSYLTPGGQAVQLWQRKVNTFWKPVLWFVKGAYEGDWIGDVAKSAVNDNDKRFHEWGQSESGMADLINRFSYPGDVILDPFLGGGTTGLVALQMDRYFVGVDADEAALETARQRILGDGLG